MILFLNYREIIEKLKKTIRNSNYSKNYLCVTRPLGKGVMKICSKFNAEQTCQSVISIKLLSNFIEITLRHGCSPVNLLHIFRTPFTENTFWRLLLYHDTINEHTSTNSELSADLFPFTKEILIRKINFCILSKIM